LLFSFSFEKASVAVSTLLIGVCSIDESGRPSPKDPLRKALNDCE
jgi:hypothetical protein